MSVLSSKRSHNFRRELAHLIMARGVNFKLLQYSTDSTIFIFQAKLTGLCRIWRVDWQLHISLNNVKNTFVYLENHEHRNAARLSRYDESLWSTNARRLNAILKSKKRKNKIWNARRILPRGNESAVRRKHTDGRLRRQRAEHAEADPVSSVFEFGFQLDPLLYTYTVIPRLTKIIRYGITFVSRNLR